MFNVCELNILNKINMKNVNYFKPISIALQINGINYVEEKKTSYSMLKKCLQKLMTAVFYFSIGFTFYEVCSKFKNLSEITPDSQSVGFFGYYFAVFSTYTLMQFKRRSLHNLIVKLYFYSQNLIESQSKILYGAMALAITVPWALSLFDLVYHLTQWNYNENERTLGILWGLFLNPFNFFCVTLSVFICYTLNLIFKKFKTEMNKKLDQRMDHSTWCRLIKDFIVQHKSLSELVDDLDNVYSGVYLVYFIFYVTLTVFLVRALNLNKPMYEWNYRLLPNILQMICLFLSQVMAVTCVNSQVLSSLHLMKPQILVSDHYFEESRLATILTNTELSLYIQQVSSNPSALTAGHLFVIDKGSILSVGATVLTYILVLYGNSS